MLLVSDSKAVTVTVGRQQDKEEDTVTAVPVGQVPAAQQLWGTCPPGSQRCKGERYERSEVRGKKEREGITDGLEITVI